MAIIRSHLTGHPYKPRREWPDQAHVQWGDHGLVFGEGKSYNTAFFEAFPRDGTAGFIRGEGATIADAEDNAFAQWEKFFECKSHGGHQWGRSRHRVVGDKPYANGGCFCRRCGAFETVMQPIVELGGWKEPISDMELDAISLGSTWNMNSQKIPKKFQKRLYLRARVFGVNIPKPPSFDEYEEFAGTRKSEMRALYREYVSSCERAVAQYLKDKPEQESAVTEGVGTERLFSCLVASRLKKLKES
ncbi:hypothetical protein AA14337_2946 [Acetobacter malorum DSM 14337]|uniref:Uncharacterized protein n=1 Tax=Acetobacter malorum DSM 14337 TaxID=1307910 RepID=A0ABQ0PYQ8_9PROT|nr:hypothetical protein [Acetobacter malorum]KXV06750.1 hypothetical protein AD930_06525 [Acetobacter malorum]GBQ84913.1 hypothetical protein AA14337_2946 [Acetobacter malorum DSM 14337]